MVSAVAQTPDRTRQRPPQQVEKAMLSGNGVNVTWKKSDLARIPDDMVEGVGWFLELSNSGRLAELCSRVRIRREGGFCGVDVLLFMLLYFCTSPQKGIRSFSDTLRRCNSRVAAVAGRAKLPTSSSVSRALGSVELELLRPTAEWLLSEGSGIDAVISHPAMLTYDSQGEGWMLLDCDPTVTTLRQRALPVGEDLPEAKRRAEGFAAPGYQGRKRGDTQIRRTALQHAGSGAWLAGHMGPGNGDGHADLRAALGTLVRTCTRLGRPLSRTVIRMDGEFGWVPYLCHCREFKVPFVTRLTRPAMLDRPDVRKALAEGPWYLVPDSGSGPKRGAMDLGVVMLEASSETCKEDGSSYEPVEVRVVVSRYPRTGKAQRGRVIGMWQYEMFVVDVSPNAFPAAEAVAEFFGRAGEENRFSQENREVRLNRILSYHLPGQEFAVTVGMWLWNLRIVRGFMLETPPDTKPQQRPHVAQLDERQESQITDVGEETISAECPSHDVGIEEIGAMKLSSQPDNYTSYEQWEIHENISENLLSELNSLDWEQTLRNHKHFSFDSTSGQLICPNGKFMRLKTVPNYMKSSRFGQLRFVRKAGSCHACPLLSSCWGEGRAGESKTVAVHIPQDSAARLRELLRASRQKRSIPPRRASPVKKPRKPTCSFKITQQPAPSPVYAVLPSLFLPAKARQIATKAMSGVSMNVTYYIPPLSPSPVLLASSVEEKQQRRCTWTKNAERYALPPGAKVHLEIVGDESVRYLLNHYQRKEVT